MNKNLKEALYVIVGGGIILGLLSYLVNKPKKEKKSSFLGIGDKKNIRKACGEGEYEEEGECVPLKNI